MDEPSAAWPQPKTKVNHKSIFNHEEPGPAKPQPNKEQKHFSRKGAKTQRKKLQQMFFASWRESRFFVILFHIPDNVFK